MEDLYREIIIERYKRPRFRGSIEKPDFEYEDENPLCGDRIRIQVKLDDQGRIQEARFQGEGCAISIASADLLLESIQGKPLDEVRQLSKEFVLDLIGLRLSPARIKCALLGFKVLKAGILGLGKKSEDGAETRIG